MTTQEIKDIAQFAGLLVAWAEGTAPENMDKAMTQEHITEVTEAILKRSN